jgi:hypothetical protein
VEVADPFAAFVLEGEGYRRARQARITISRTRPLEESIPALNEEGMTEEVHTVLASVI